jgi:hypothetical protein
VANFSFTVETHEMAQALHSVAPHVDGATAAVVSMQVAVIQAERRAADDICGNVNRGFFSLIRSQITQKIAISRSQVDARLLELRDLSMKLSTIKTTMQRDFQMITGRYVKLFRTLDLALLSRVRELDMPLLDMVQKDLVRLAGRTCALQAAVPIHQLESVRSSQLIAASSAKARTGRAIASMTQFIAESNRQDSLTASILSGQNGGAEATMLLPVALVESDSVASRQRQWLYFMPPAPASEFAGLIKGAVERGIFPALNRMEWSPQETSERERVSRCFYQMLDGAQLKERVRAQMMRGFTDAPAPALHGVRP